MVDHFVVCYNLPTHELIAVVSVYMVRLSPLQLSHRGKASRIRILSARESTKGIVGTRGRVDVDVFIVLHCGGVPAMPPHSLFRLYVISIGERHSFSFMMFLVRCRPFVMR